jgi:hypothetical protein
MQRYTTEEILKILRKNKSLLRKYGVRRIGLFGSGVRNESKADSDIDLVVEFYNKSFDNFMELNFALEELFDAKVDLVTENSISQYMIPYIQNEIHWYEAS